MLVEASTKLIMLRHQQQWATELPPRCPPILWFGDAQSSKPKIVTIGANPSRQEYLDDPSEQALQKVRQTGDDSLLRYLEAPHNRFRLLDKTESLSDISKQAQLQFEIIQGYNHYFDHRPYAWFGKSGDNSYNVEGFLHGLGASYYNHPRMPYVAIHIDLFPFATLSNFTDMLNLADASLFQNGWAQTLVAALINMLNPVSLLIFGKTNVQYFTTYIDRSLIKIPKQHYTKGDYWLGVAEQFSLPVVGLSTNLGNPIGFDKAGLRQYGAHIRQQMKLSNQTL